jgi:hypothetical protein
MADSKLNKPSPYSGCCAIITTKHAKSVAIAPSFWERLGMSVLEYPLDTDMVGTFSGEVERKCKRLNACGANAKWGWNTAYHVFATWRFKRLSHCQL